METFPNPGNGYTIREKLGTGNWKTAYRASSMHSAADIALLYFHDDSLHSAFTGEVINHLHTIRKHPYSHYVAEFKGIQQDPDGRWYIVEELLARPLDRIGSVNDIVRFVRIARDLSRGLACLHSEKLVHRDLKLDNCGLDHREQAKIFDLGLVTSDPKDIRGNIFSRAPELFGDGGLFDSRPTLASDVWALGATLFALRFGEYPFVHHSEVQERGNINSQLKSGAILPQEATEKKMRLQKRVQQRVEQPNAERDLVDRVEKEVGGRAGELLVQMLSFRPSSRLSAEGCSLAWGHLANDLGGANPVTTPDEDRWGEIKNNLERVRRGEFVITRKQAERLAKELQDERERDRDSVELKTIEGIVADLKSDNLVGLH